MSDITVDHMKEINKVITAVLLHHFQKYYNQFKEFRSMALVYVCEHHSKFNPNMDAYNYIYTMVRNVIGNFVNKKSNQMEEGFEVLPDSPVQVLDEFDGVLRKYKDYLSGDVKFTFVVVDKNESLPLLGAVLAVLNPKESQEKRSERINRLLITSIYERN